MVSSGPRSSNLRRQAYLSIVSVQVATEQSAERGGERGQHVLLGGKCGKGIQVKVNRSGSKQSSPTHVMSIRDCREDREAAVRFALIKFAARSLSEKAGFCVPSFAWLLPNPSLESVAACQKSRRQASREWRRTIPDLLASPVLCPLFDKMAGSRRHDGRQCKRGRLVDEERGRSRFQETLSAEEGDCAKPWFASALSLLPLEPH